MTVSPSYSSCWSCSSFDFGHHVSTHAERPSVNMWDDTNSNQARDAGETFNLRYFSVTGHSMSVTNQLTYGNFDRDGDNLPDWWEVANGLSTNGVKEDEYADPDNDGLINLHEFWAGTNPLVPDGSNTLLSVVSRSVDDRIAGIDVQTALNRFENFYANAPNGVFAMSSNFWATGSGPAAYLRLQEIQNHINTMEGTTSHPYQIEIYSVSDFPQLQNRR